MAWGADVGRPRSRLASGPQPGRQAARGSECAQHKSASWLGFLPRGEAVKHRLPGTLFSSAAGSPRRGTSQPASVLIGPDAPEPG